MTYEQDRAAKEQDSTEAMVRMRQPHTRMHPVMADALAPFAPKKRSILDDLRALQEYDPSRPDICTRAIDEIILLRTMLGEARQVINDNCDHTCDGMLSRIDATLGRTV